MTAARFGREEAGVVTRKVVLLAVIFALLGAGCASEDPLSATSSSASFPVTISAPNGPVTVPERPERVVSLSPTATEMLYAIGAGDQVVAVDDQSNYPTDAPRTKLSGFQPNAEAVAKERPDLVVLANDINEVVKSLQALKIPTLLQPAAAKLDDSYTQIEQLGAATGHVGGAAKVVGDMRSRIDDLTRSATGSTLTYYHELDQKLFSVTSNTFIGQVYSLVGLRNIADAAKGAGTGYPQLSAEYVIQADPDVIFLADTKCCGQSAAKVRARPGWDKIAAVRSGAVVALDDDVASRWGPRIVDLLEIVSERVSALEPAKG
jgi:iron complex transport system substrate-binding protein